MSYQTPAELKYTKDHEWVRIEGDIAVVGIDDYAQKALGDLVYVELPAVGKVFAAGDDMAVVESFKTASDVYAPLSGEIVAINDTVTATPETINGDTYGAGWLVKIKFSDAGEVANLLSAEAYAPMIAD